MWFYNLLHYQVVIVIYLRTLTETGKIYHYYANMNPCFHINSKIYQINWALFWMMGNEDQWHYVFSNDFSLINFLSIFLADIKAPSNSGLCRWTDITAYPTRLSVQFSVILHCPLSSNYMRYFPIFYVQ